MQPLLKRCDRPARVKFILACIPTLSIEWRGPLAEQSADRAFSHPI